MTFIWVILALGFAVIGGFVSVLLFNTIRIFRKEMKEKKLVEMEVKNADKYKRA